MDRAKRAHEGRNLGTTREGRAFALALPSRPQRQPTQWRNSSDGHRRRL